MSRIAFIYPGQGAQKVGMGQEFYEREVAAKAIYDQASQVLDMDMQSLCFEENIYLDQTEYTQVALVVTCLAMTEVLKERGISPDVTAGLSLGEYCAIATAGGMTILEAIQAVRQRGILMQNAVPLGEGAMTAVLGLESEQIEQVLTGVEGVSIANYNCPGQIVITGCIDRVAQAEDLLKEAGARRVLRLNVSGPFHSKMLVNAGQELETVLQEISWKELQIPYVTNVTAEYVTDIKQTEALLVEQISAPVRWEQSVRQMIEEGVDIFIEIGPGKTLAGFMKKIDNSVTVYNMQTMEDVEQIVQRLFSE